MRRNAQNIGKAFAPRFVDHALRTFDKATMVVVLASWSIAVVAMAFALYTVNLSVVAKREVAAAAAAEPSLPREIITALSDKELQPILEKLRRNFSDITFSVSGTTLNVSTADVGSFRLWLTVLGYIDTMSPQYRWRMNEFCVGMKCGNNTPMRASLTAEKITFAQPDAGKS